MSGTCTEPGATDPLRRFLYGQESLDDWTEEGAGRFEEPWPSFKQAQLLVREGNTGQAVEIWRRIGLTTGLSSRHALQAWHFIRQAGSKPPAELASTVLATAAEVPMHGSHDLLVAYQDGTASYVNYSGRAMAWDDDSAEHVRAAISRWLAVAQRIANVIGDWDEPSLPLLPAGHARVLALTTSGPRFGQGPEEALSADPMASAFLGAANGVLQLIIP